MEIYNFILYINLSAQSGELAIPVLIYTGRYGLSNIVYIIGVYVPSLISDGKGKRDIVKGKEKKYSKRNITAYFN